MFNICAQLFFVYVSFMVYNCYPVLLILIIVILRSNNIVYIFYVGTCLNVLAMFSGGIFLLETLDTELCSSIFKCMNCAR